MIKKKIIQFITVLMIASLSTIAYSKDELLTGELSISTIMRINNETVGVNGLTIENDANLSCEFYFNNTSIINDQNVCIVLSIYEGNSKLIKIVPVSGKVLSNNKLQLNLTHTFTETGENIYAKILVWDTFNNVIPLTAKIQFDRTGGHNKISNIYNYDVNNRLLRLDKANGEKIHFTYDNNGNLLSKEFEY